MAHSTSRFASTPRSKSLPRVCGIAITSPNLAMAIEDTLALAEADKPAAVFTLNLDHAVKLDHDERFRAAYAKADVVTADGWPIAWLARRQGTAVARTTGADLFLPLVDAAAERQLPVFLFGSSAYVMARVGHEISQRTEGRLDLAGTLSPSNSFDPRGPEADRAIEQIRKSGARLCFVALGAPKQEVFADYARQKGLACCMVCVGAALDFVAGVQVRAPEAIRNNGFEWLWRLASNPRRLARRYAQSAMMLAYLIVRDAVKAPVPGDEGQAGQTL